MDNHTNEFYHIHMACLLVVALCWEPWIVVPLSGAGLNITHVCKEAGHFFCVRPGLSAGEGAPELVVTLYTDIIEIDYTRYTESVLFYQYQRVMMQVIIKLYHQNWFWFPAESGIYGNWSERLRLTKAARGGVWRPARLLRVWDSRPRCPRISVVWRPART